MNHLVIQPNAVRVTSLLLNKSKIVAVLFEDCTSAKFSNMACVFLPKNETNISKAALLFLDIFKSYFPCFHLQSCKTNELFGDTKVY